jgi:hypothetical protein
MNHIIGVPKAQFKFTKGEDKVKYHDLSPKMFAGYCSGCGGHCVQGPKGGPFWGTMAACYDANKGKEPLATLDPFFVPKAHVNYENRIMNCPDDLPKFLDMPAAFGGSGKMYEAPKL